jgi:rubrerythrin
MAELDLTRGEFIVRGAIATGAVYGAAAVGPYVSRALGATAGNDIGVLTFALSLEEVEAAFYKHALANAGLTGRVKEIATEFGAHEVEHAETLSKLVQQLGEKPGEPSKTSFPVTDEESFLKVAVMLEDVGVAAYNGAAPLIETPDLIAAAGGIVQVEARHSGALRMLAGRDPSPDAFDRPLGPEEVSARFQPYLRS